MQSYASRHLLEILWPKQEQINAYIEKWAMKIIKWFTSFHLLYLFSCYVMLLAAAFVVVAVAAKLVFLPFGICFVHLWWKLPHKKYTHLHDFNRLCVHQYTFASLCLLPHCKMYLVWTRLFTYISLLSAYMRTILKWRE